MTTPTDSRWFVVDSAGWIEVISDGPKAAAFWDYLSQEDKLVVPTVVIYEVVKKLMREDADGGSADRFLSAALRCNVVSLTDRLAVAAAELSVRHRLAMADAVVYATARDSAARLVTSDPHFEGLPGVTIL